MQKKQIVLGIFLVFLSIILAAPSYILGEVTGGMPSQNKFLKEELDQMLAPIALYPDSLLAQMLMAATYPLEVVAADRWVKENPNLNGDALDSALKEKDWDVSVKSLAHFPQVLGMMDEKIEWTTRVGDAFLAQKDEVMDSIQVLRAKADSAGNLRSTQEQRVVNEQGGIEIEPADGGMIYVPEYDPLLIYGPWWYPAFPPFAFYYPGVEFDGFFGFAFGFGWGFGFGWCDFDWHHHGIYVDYDRCGHFHSFDHARFHGRGNGSMILVTGEVLPIGIKPPVTDLGLQIGIEPPVIVLAFKGCTRVQVEGEVTRLLHRGYSGYSHGGYSGYSHGGYSGYSHGGYSHGGYFPWRGKRLPGWQRRRQVRALIF